ncbi:MAG TPA: SCP2 sterol-binding domain-containing protein [Acidimicrobiales bacterium]|nr:SCP2 sterol-binding domain-containing protein [Acidimicrobiales bacterium]
MAYQFLSDEWIEAARKLREEVGAPATAPQPVRMNLVITDVPFGSGSLDAHLDTTSGQVDLDTGHLDAPDVTATLDYETAKAILVDGNPQAAMQAFMAGKIKLQGDMTKAMAMQSGPVNAELAKKIQEITE